MEKQLTCKKCGEVIDRDKENVHKIFCYAWVDDEHN
jgi:formylmethanofuran dehydrogenase subunit E